MGANLPISLSWVDKLLLRTDTHVTNKKSTWTRSRSSTSPGYVRAHSRYSMHFQTWKRLRAPNTQTTSQMRMERLYPSLARKPNWRPPTLVPTSQKNEASPRTTWTTNRTLLPAYACVNAYSMALGSSWKASSWSKSKMCCGGTLQRRSLVEFPLCSTKSEALYERRLRLRSSAQTVIYSRG